MLARQIERIQRARRLDDLVVATSDRLEDAAVEALCAKLGVECFRGKLNDVLDRFYRAAASRHPAAVVRLTGDCPLIDPEVIDGLIEFFDRGVFDYASNTLVRTWPDGLDAEVMRFECLETAWEEAARKFDREHVTPFIKRNPERFRLGSYLNQVDLSAMRWTVDEPSDLEFVRKVYAELYPSTPAFLLDDVLALLRHHPELAVINAGFECNANCQDTDQP